MANLDNMHNVCNRTSIQNIFKMNLSNEIIKLNAMYNICIKESFLIKLKNSFINLF